MINYIFTIPEFEMCVKNWLFAFHFDKKLYCKNPSLIYLSSTGCFPNILLSLSFALPFPSLLFGFCTFHSDESTFDLLLLIGYLSPLLNQKICPLFLCDQL